MNPDVQHIKRLRAILIEALYARHAAQQHRPDHVALWSIVTALGSEASENEVITQLQDAGDRGYVTYFQEKNRRTGAVTISKIQLTSKGRDLAEGTIRDEAYLF